MLSVSGGVLGLGLAFSMVKGLVGLCPADIPRLRDTGIDPSVLAFTLAVSVLTGLLFSMMPAWRASDVHMGQTLKETGRSWAGRGWRRVHASLVVCQIGLSVVLLVGAGLVIRSLIALQGIDLGFQPKNLLVMQIELPGAMYPESQQARAFSEPLVQRIQGLPGVRSVGVMTMDLDLSTGPMDMEITVPGQTSVEPDKQYSARWASVSPSFFETLGIRLLAGGASQSWMRRSLRVIIDQTLAKRCFGDADPIGQVIKHEGYP